MKLNHESEKHRLGDLDRLKASVELGFGAVTHHALPELRVCPVVDRLRELLRLQLVGIELMEGLDIANVSQDWIDLEYRRFNAVARSLRIITEWQVEYNKNQTGETSQESQRRKLIPKRRRR